MSVAGTAAHLLLRILLARNVGKMVCLSPKIYYQSENAVIAVMRMSIMYANSAEPCMTIWAAMSIYVMGVCREMIKIGFEPWHITDKNEDLMHGEV